MSRRDASDQLTNAIQTGSSKPCPPMGSLRLIRSLRRPTVQPSVTRFWSSVDIARPVRRDRLAKHLSKAHAAVKTKKKATVPTRSLPGTLPEATPACAKALCHQCHFDREISGFGGPEESRRCCPRDGEPRLGECRQPSFRRNRRTSLLASDTFRPDAYPPRQS